MLSLFHETAFKCSELITKHYSTSFSLGIKTLDKSLHHSIYAIYGFVRYADEIVDTFHDFDKADLLKRFKKDTYQAISEKISLNPILHSFQLTVNKYQIKHELIEAFLKSMEMDLEDQTYDSSLYNEYIYGSAEVVGLMCLQVFCQGNEKEYEILEKPAKSLGAAFQKVNFLRDMKSDYLERGRVYFPKVNFDSFDAQAKQNIEADIQKDFDDAYKNGILKLPKTSRLGVYLAYVYYLKLFEKIKKISPEKVLKQRIRVNNASKFVLLVQTYFKQKLNYI
ncbi:MAG: phytoene/squalene synthase family protein [Bacteroidetes bacterium]|nr:MAG: phytoene/squalene synthase family protein [Bacteroidota bacterium]